MTSSITFELTEETFERANADLAVAGFFSDELPLRGGVGRVDWRLCGLVSEQLLAGRIHGNADEAMLLLGEGRLRAPRVMIVGLGPRASYRQAQVASSARNIFLRCSALGVGSVALPPLGVEAEDFPRFAAAFLQGAVEGAAMASHPILARLVIPEDEHATTRRAFLDAARAMNRPELVPPQRISPSVQPDRVHLGPASNS